MKQRISAKALEAQDQSLPILWGKSQCSDLCSRHQQNLTPAQFYVLFRLCRYANDKTGVAWPSPEALAYDLDMDRSNVRKRLIEMVEMGILRETRIDVPSRYAKRRIAYQLVDPDEADDEKVVSILRSSDTAPPDMCRENTNSAQTSCRENTKTVHKRPPETVENVDLGVKDGVELVSNTCRENLITIELGETRRELAYQEAHSAPSASLRSAGAPPARPRSEGHGRFTKDEIIAFLVKSRGCADYVVKAMVYAHIAAGILTPDAAGLYRLDEVLM